MTVSQLRTATFWLFIVQLIALAYSILAGMSTEPAMTGTRAPVTVESPRNTPES